MKTHYILLSFLILAAFVALWYARDDIRAAFLTNTSPTVSLTSGLVGHWTFDGNRLFQNAADSSGQGNTGYLTNIATSTAQTVGVHGQALKLDTNGSVRMADSGSLDLTSAFTISAWIRPDNVSFTGNPDEDGAIVAKHNSAGATGYTFVVTNADNDTQATLDCYTGDGVTWPNGAANSADGDVNVGVWNHVVCSFDGTTLRVYRDTAEVASDSTGNNAVAANTNELWIGDDVNKGTGQNEFNGAIDDVRLYNRALTTDEIKRLYDLGNRTKNKVNTSPTASFISGLAGYWTFDGNRLFQNAADSSGQGNTGYLSNFAATSTVVRAGVHGQALEFDGSNDYVDLGSVMTSVDPLTINMWVKKKNAITAAATLTELKATVGSSYIFYFNDRGGDGDTLELGKRNDGGGDRIAILDDASLCIVEWCMVTGVITGTSLASKTIFVNGVLQTNVGTFTEGADIGGTSNVNVIAAQTGGGSPFDGVIDDVRIYSRALTGAEIQTLYNLGSRLRNKINVSPTTQLTSGLAGYWTFDGGKLFQNATDSSGQGNTGYLSGFATSSAVTPGVHGQALTFDNTNDYIDVGAASSLSFSITQSFTVSAWVRTNSAEDDMVYAKYDSDNGRGLQFIMGGSSNSGRMQIGLDNNGTTFMNRQSSSSVNDNRWHHVLATYGGTATSTGFNLYVDGALSNGTLTNGSGAIDANTDVTTSLSATIGRRMGGSALYYNGTTDDVRVYNRALSVGEVRQLYDLAGRR